MADLILRPSGFPELSKEFALQVRHHDCCGPTEYVTLAYASEAEAREIIQAGAPFWLFGDPAKCVAAEVDHA